MWSFGYDDPRQMGALQVSVLSASVEEGYLDRCQVGRRGVKMVAWAGHAGNFGGAMTSDRL